MSGPADIALGWWQAYGEGAVDELWRLSARPVRYMLTRSIVADELTRRSASGDGAAVDDLLIACQGAAVHGVRGPAWDRIAPYCTRFLDPIDMGSLLGAMRNFPRTEAPVEGYVQITFHPPDTPAMPWIVSLVTEEVVGFTGVLRGSDDAAELGERLARDPTALWVAPRAS